MRVHVPIRTASVGGAQPQRIDFLQGWFKDNGYILDSRADRIGNHSAKVTVIVVRRIDRTERATVSGYFKLSDFRQDRVMGKLLHKAYKLLNSSPRKI